MYITSFILFMAWFQVINLQRIQIIGMEMKYAKDATNAADDATDTHRVTLLCAQPDTILDMLDGDAHAKTPSKLRPATPHSAMPKPLVLTKIPLIKQLKQPSSEAIAPCFVMSLQFLVLLMRCNYCKLPDKLIVRPRFDDCVCSHNRSGNDAFSMG